jgi:hypothetical protein
MGKGIQKLLGKLNLLQNIIQLLGTNIRSAMNASLKKSNIHVNEYKIVPNRRKILVNRNKANMKEIYAFVPHIS